MTFSVFEPRSWLQPSKLIHLMTSWRCNFFQYMLNHCLLFFSTSGTCWTSSSGTPCPQLLLGWTGLYLQVLRSDHDWSLPQGHPQRPQDQLDHQASHEAQGAQGSYPRRKIIQRLGQGTQVHPDQGRFPQCCLAAQELSQASPKAIDSRGLSPMTTTTTSAATFSFCIESVIIKTLTSNTVALSLQIIFHQIHSKWNNM